MKRSLLLYHICISLLFLLLCTIAADAQKRDSVFIIQSPGGSPYRCCYDFIVTSRQDSGTLISEFRARIISGRATFVPGVSSSPPDWSIFQQSTSVRWLTNTSEAELDSGEMASGFRVCAADTGIFRIVWETRNLDSVVSSDTLAFACGGTGCDEAFFTVIPGSASCVLDVDLLNGNRIDKVVNDFHLRLLTPGARLQTAPAAQPAGWTRTRLDTTLVSYFTTNGLSFGQWVEGFRVALTSPTDSVRIAVWSTNFGDLICTDTLTLRCRYEAADSIRISRTTTTIDSCCRDLQLRNIHRPATPLDAFIVNVLTPGAKLSGLPMAPAGWTRQPLPAAGDSVRFITSGQFGFGDSALFRNICFDNSGASSDTVRYRISTMYRGVVITEQSDLMVCVRPLTRRDTVTAVVDSAVTVGQRCVKLMLTNRNSRNTVIERFVVKLSNPGIARSILSAKAPAGWQVLSSSGDSIVYGGGRLNAGSSLTGFEFCVSAGDTAMRDPLHLRWFTSNTLGAISSDTLSLRINIVIPCDSITWAESASSDFTVCCFKLRLHNGNKDLKNLDGLQLRIANPAVIFSGAEADNGWSVVSPSFPNTSVGFTGSPLAPGDSTPELTVCIDVRNISARPVTIPVVWQSFASGSQVCTDTMRLVCTGVFASECDTVIAVSSDNTGGICSFGFRVVNLHTHSSVIDAVEFTRVAGKGRFIGGLGTGSAAGWTSVQLTPDTLIFRGDSIATLDSAEAFIVRLDSTDGGALTLRACTRSDGIIICCTEMILQCAAAGVDGEAIPDAMEFIEVTPNPTGSHSTIRMQMRKGGDLSLSVTSITGAVVHQVEYSRLPAGEHRLNVDMSQLPSGVYIIHVAGDGFNRSERLLVVR